jgi:CheY-like chemotaxis protein
MEPKGRVLIVDDNSINVDILRRLLCKDFELATAASGEECLSLVPTFTALSTDCRTGRRV